LERHGHREVPTADDLVKRFEYHLDFPGDALHPGCDYNRWAKRLTRGSAPVVYSHVVGEEGAPGKLALQYWFFYPFNDFNNTHEGDWEMIQLLFDAPDARAALETTPVEVGYSSHEGARSRLGRRQARARERPARRVSGSRIPCQQVRRRALARALGGGRVGCDDTAARNGLSPRVVTIPSGGPPPRPYRGSHSRALGRAQKVRSSTADRPQP
jgi:hypothetical protein